MLGQSRVAGKPAGILAADIESIPSKGRQPAGCDADGCTLLQSWAMGAPDRTNPALANRSYC